ncbi:hypothetical protein TNCV_1773661 [Trichonephila clavipes]|nr:hypothetical protein TNCV_1773661 [Trichonephila clavipes]
MQKLVLMLQKFEYDKERSGTSIKFKDKELEELFDQNPCETLAELGKLLQVDGSTVSKPLKALGMNGISPRVTYCLYGRMGKCFFTVL